MCRNCGEVKDTNEFYRRPTSPDGFRNDCKKCRISSASKYIASNRERVRRNHFHYYRSVSRHIQLRDLYGITKARYMEMFKSQDGRCAICRNKSTIDLAVDHNHKTGEIRELLCRNCNLGVGRFKDDIELLKSAINYLIKHSAPPLQPSKEEVNAERN